MNLNLTRLLRSALEGDEDALDALAVELYRRREHKHAGKVSAPLWRLLRPNPDTGDLEPASQIYTKRHLAVEMARLQTGGSFVLRQYEAFLDNDRCLVKTIIHRPTEDGPSLPHAHISEETDTDGNS